MSMGSIIHIHGYNGTVQSNPGGVSMNYSTSNPALRPSVLRSVVNGMNTASGTMTLDGVVIKSLVLFAIAVLTAGATWSGISSGSIPGLVLPVALIGGLIVAIVTIFKPVIAPYTAWLYALCEGVVLGAVSQAYNALYQGIVAEAVLLTAAVFFLMLILFGAGILKPTRRFVAIVTLATGAIALYYVASLVFGMVSGGQLPLISSATPLGIGFSIVVVIVASLNLVIDFGTSSLSSTICRKRHEHGIRNDDS